MRKITILIMAVALVVLMVGVSSFAKETPKEAKELHDRALAKRTALSGQWQILNINNLWTWVENNGESNHSPNGDNGVYYPRGSCWVIYKDGFKWGGMCYTDENYTQGAPYGQTIRMGGNDYGSGTVPGWIEGFGATAQRVDPGLDECRVWRIRRDYASMTDAEMRQDASEYFEDWVNPAAVSDNLIADIRNQYALDWENWPVNLGAPFIDRNGNGVFDKPPAFGDDFTVDSLIAQGWDEPGIAGADPNSPADQVLWNVYNDLDRQEILDLEGSEPMGLEIQRTVWGYKRTDALGNIYFSKYKFINKGGVDVAGDGSTRGTFYIDSMYVAQWSDPDLGEYSEDLLGCDTTLSMGYVYNGNPIDAEYRAVGQVVPAAGYDFLQGPMVKGEAGDRAVFDLKYREGFRNLPMTAFAWFSAGSPISDPASDYDGGREWYRMYQGWQPSFPAYKYYPLPPGTEATHFPLSGDPVTQTGLLDGLGEEFSFPPGDRRLLLCSGPFTMAPGDTQEVVVGFVAGQGADRFSSISVMKFNDRFVQNTYDALFQVPKAPKTPRVNVAELDRKIVLDWGSDLQNVKDIETTVAEPGQYEFEGYNVYQLPLAGSSLSEAVRVATFDLLSDPTVILTEGFDAKSGQILDIPVQFGSNSGIKRYLEITRDYVLDKDKIFNGQEYYFGVTAYSHTKVEGFLPASLESQPQVMRCVPKKKFGTEFSVEHGDTLEVEHVSGASDGIITPIVIDPLAATGDTYEIRFEDTGADVLQWKVVNITDNKDIITGTNQTNDTNYDMVEGGIFLKVSGPPPGVKDWDWDGSRFLTWAESDWGHEGFGGALGWNSPRGAYGDGTMIIPADKLHNVEIRFADVAADGTFDPNQENVSYGYRYGRNFGSAAQQPEFAQFIKNTAGGYSYQDFTKSVPLAVYDIDADPPRRLAVGHLENNQPDGMVDGKYWPPYYGDIGNVSSSGPREWLWIFDADYSETPNPEYEVEIIDGSQPVFLWATWARRNTNPWTSNDVMTIFVNRPNTVDDVFRYTATLPVSDLALQKSGVKKISVYPNPYYAFNPAEIGKFDTFVTFAGLPPTKCTIRIFNLAGQLVRTLEKNDNTEFLRWELQNHDRLPVASGMYIAHVQVELPAGGEGTKVLKFAIIQEQEILNVY